MIRPLIAARLETEMHRGGEHGRVLARAIVMDGLRSPPCLYQLAHRSVADRPMRAAGKIALVESRFCEQASYRFDMHPVTAMRGAGDSKLIIAEAEGLRRATLDERDRLHR